MSHEDRKNLPNDVLELKRAIDSLVEELEAVQWYDERAAATEDEELKKILIHNRDEEKEHAAMLMEWIRRNDKPFEKEMKEYLFNKAESIAEIEEKD